MDVGALEARTGWSVRHVESTGSTNDLAAQLVAAGAGPRTVVVADRQTHGRGRDGRAFASPAGGLYASFLVAVPPEDVPAGAVALVAVAVAQAIDAVTGLRAGIKWPNDLWLERRKVGGILLEKRSPEPLVTAGVGINLAGVPRELPAPLRDQLGALAPLAGRPVTRDAVLLALLMALDALQAQRSAPGGSEAIEQAWRERLVLVGESITCTFAGRRLEGILEDVSLARGLLVRDPLSGPVWRPAEHVQDLRAEGRTI